MARPTYSKQAAEIGRLAEEWINELLKTKGYDFKWFNECGESKMSPDFLIYNNGRIIAGIECEMKNVKYERFFKYGLDFLADKVDRLFAKRIPIYYYICISDKSKAYYGSMEHIRNVSSVEYKNTSRMLNEKFYRVQLEDLKELIW